MIVISGLSGWLGRALAHVLIYKHGVSPKKIVGIGSAERKLTLYSGEKLEIKTWEGLQTQDLKVDLFANFGFLTRDKIEDLPTDEYVFKNQKIIECARLFMEHNRPSRILSVSSGAVYEAPKFNELTESVKVNPYGYLKLVEEQMLMDFCMQNNSSLVITRLWGLSGEDIQNTKPYALADFIFSVLKSADISIRSKTSVFRRYVDARELMNLQLTISLDDSQTVFNSGGPKIEIRDLARLTNDVLNGHSRIQMPELDPSAVPDLYFPTDYEYEELIGAYLNKKPLDLELQIENTARGVRRLLGLQA